VPDRTVHHQPGEGAHGIRRRGDDWLLAASNGGARSQPSWVLNAATNPDVEVKVGGAGKPKSMRAVLLSDQEKAKYWDGIVGSFQGSSTGPTAISPWCV
jgi:deazaflavin-dependent oxidoreductase (nitroreductase family)